jgi:hypothetical protein
MRRRWRLWSSWSPGVVARRIQGRVMPARPEATGRSADVPDAHRRACRDFRWGACGREASRREASKRSTLSEFRGDDPRPASAFC